MKLDQRYLKQKIPEETFDKPISNQQLSILLTNFMLKTRAIGLAANQVGYKKRVFVMNIDGQQYCCFNPSLISFDKDTETMVEGCLSFPKDRLSIARPISIVVKYYDYIGNETCKTLTGLAARCFQHELDHLNGITMHQRTKEDTNVLPESRN